MKRIVLWLVSTLAVVVLLLGYRTSTSGPAVLAHPGSYVAGTATSTSADTVTGDAIDTRYGPVQVELDLENGTIVAARVLQHPSGSSTDEQINARALPILLNQTVGEDAADIQVDMVSGATYTSAGYHDSLQSALDKAAVTTSTTAVAR